MLKDPEAEKQYKFSLSKAIENGRKNQGNLFQGKTFYIGQKVPIEFKLFKNVIQDNGGQVCSCAHICLFVQS